MEEDEEDDEKEKKIDESIRGSISKCNAYSGSMKWTSMQSMFWYSWSLF